ncbi:MAG: hypothetical protein ACXW1Z_26010, partial [Methylobacter sp.]
MSKPTFWEGVVVALIVSITGAIGFFAASLIFPEDGAIRLVISGLAFFYSLYLLSRSRERIGRITVMLSWCILSAAVWLFDPQSGCVSLRPVTVVRYEANTAVIADGLAKGDIVVTA